MKRFFLLFSALLVLSAPAFAAEQPQKPGAPGAEVAAPKKKKFVVRLRNGGTIETDNYAIVDGKVKMNLPAGAISIDRSSVKSIVEVSGDTGTVQETLKPSPAPKPKEPSGRRREIAPPPPAPRETMGLTDNQGHSEAWWKHRAGEWKKKLAEAEKRYQDASAAWNQYNGVLQGMGPDAAQFEVLKYQDLRGSARTSMDQAQADMEEAKQMLEVGLPDEARKAGAPPGWVR